MSDDVTSQQSEQPVHVDDIPWAMQLVIHRDRQRPQREVDIAEAAARAVVALISDPRAQGEGPWAEPVRIWTDVAIRKLVRRADGKRWDDVQSLDGVTVTQAAPEGFAPADVRAFVPAPVRPLPAALNKLQVSGTTFEPDRASVNTDALVTIGVSPHIQITSGKLAAQCGHAAQLAYRQMPEATRERWAADAFRVCVTWPSVAEWDTDWPVTIQDAGFTELDGPTVTTRARW